MNDQERIVRNTLDKAIRAFCVKALQLREDLSWKELEESIDRVIEDLMATAIASMHEGESPPDEADIEDDKVYLRSCIQEMKKRHMHELLARN